MIMLYIYERESREIIQQVTGPDRGACEAWAARERQIAPPGALKMADSPDGLSYGGDVMIHYIGDSPDDR